MSPAMSDRQKTILITGAGTGIGRDAVFALAARGHRVIAATFDEAQAADLRAQCAARAGARAAGIEVIKLDITASADRESVRRREIDVLINNAGVGDSGSLAEVDVDRIRKVFEVNVFATIELTQVVLAGMIGRSRGTVLFVSSVAGRLPVPFLMPYSMSKFALSAAGAALRSEMDQLGRNIQISLIEPGAIHTGFNQAMTDRKYEWMARQSYFRDQIDRLKASETKSFNFLEARDTGSIVAKIVIAAEARRPKLRYVAPWLQGVGVRIARILGA
jgi:short-subunit dehydrogenase